MFALDKTWNARGSQDQRADASANHGKGNGRAAINGALGHIMHLENHIGINASVTVLTSFC